MASYRALAGVMQAIHGRLSNLVQGAAMPSNRAGTVKLLASSDFTDFSTTVVGPQLGLYLHRVTVDAGARNGYEPARPGTGLEPRPILPLNLHFLVVARAPSEGAADEIAILAWGLREIGLLGSLGMPDLIAFDPDWREGETVQILPEELSTEDLLKIWEALPVKYSLTSTFVARTIRLPLAAQPADGMLIRRAIEVGGGPSA